LKLALRRFSARLKKTGLRRIAAREFLWKRPTAERKRKQAAAVKRHYKHVFAGQQTAASAFINRGASCRDSCAPALDPRFPLFRSCSPGVRRCRCVGVYVQLKKGRINLLGLCPFITKKSPSFTVSLASSSTIALAAAPHGSAVTFLNLNHTVCEFPDAVPVIGF